MRVDWTKVMTNMPKGTANLQFLKGYHGHQDSLVLARSYGAVLAILLSDDVSNSLSIMRVPSSKASEFLRPYSDTVVAPELTEQYDHISLYTSQNNLPLVGPLTSARAAYLMKYDGLGVPDAIEQANQQSLDLLVDQEKRMKTISELAHSPE